MSDDANFGDGPNPDDDRLLERVGEALHDDVAPPTDDRIAAIRAAAEQRRTMHDASVSARAGTGRLRWPVLAAAAAIVAIVFGAGVWLASDRDAGEVEYSGAISGDAGVGQLHVVKTGIGRVIDLDTDDLEILPTGEFYEVWFVGPGDRPESPNRISAGTFHPDPDGRSNVRFAAAVVPAEYPVVEITAEPADGDPSPSSDVVLTVTID